MGKIVGICVVIATFLPVITMALECNKNQYDLDGQRCCTKCAPGQGMVSPCNQDNDTVCENCRKGEMFSPVSSHEDECKPCKTCPQYSHVKKMCNGSHDTICECDHNYYWDDLSSSCRQCDLCVMGFGAKRQCDLHRNTVCAQCPKGTYSDMISDEACKVCTSCNNNQLMVRICDHMRDTICVDYMPPPPTGHSEKPQTTTSAVVVKESKQITQDKLIPVYCTILGLVILALIIYVIVKQVQYRRNPPNNKKNVSYSAVSDPSGPVTGAQPGANATSIQQALQPATRNQGSDSGVSLEHDSRPVTKSTRIKDLPAGKLKAIEQMLHSSLHHRGGWTSFARELGYSNSKISLFESKSSQTGLMPAEIMLTEWSKSGNATVEVLVDTLKVLNREDIITMIYSDNRTPSYPQGGACNGNLSGAQHPGTDSKMVPMYNLNSVNNVNNRIPPANYSNVMNLGQVQGQPMNLGQVTHIQGQPMNLSQIQGQSMNLGHVQGQPLNLGQISHMQGQPMNLGQVQGQMSPGQGQVGSSISGSSTTDVSGRFGPHQHGLQPSYHNLKGEQMV